MTKQDALDERVKLWLSGQEPQRCKEIAEGTGATELEVHRAMIRLIDKGSVYKSYRRSAPEGFVYERADGGYSPGPGDAA